MKLNYSNHYKDRTPEETVKLIKAFFEDNNYSFEEQWDDHSFNYIYTMTVNLTYNNDIIMSQRGKGVNPAFCAASAYAELYERFCNMLFILADFTLLPTYINLNNKLNGYSFSNDELSCKFKDLKIDKYFPYCIMDNINIDNNFLKQVPYHNILNDNNIIYYNPIGLKYITGSNGMAAGNTLEEALVQGISELFERTALEYINKHPNEMYTRIDLNSIANPILQNIFKEIEAQNQKIVLLDFSYNLKYPVVGIFLINTITKRITGNFGSHPVFDIAVERTLTELYQDNTHLNEIINFKQEIDLKTVVLRAPNKFLEINETSQDPANIFNENILINSKIQAAHSNYFLDSIEYSNVELLDYIKTLCVELHLNFYYRDYALIPDIKAIHIYSPNMAVVGGNNWIYKPELLNEQLSTFKKTYKLKDLNESDVSSNLFIHFKYDSKVYWAFNQALLNIYRKNTTALVDFYDKAKNTYFCSNLNKFMSIFRYKQYGYSFEKTAQIFNLVDEDISIDDWSHCTDINWIFNNILIPEYRNKYNDTYLYNIFRPFIQSK